MAVQVKNPLDRHRVTTRCAVSQIKHNWTKQCSPKKEHTKLIGEERLTGVEDCNITLQPKKSLSGTETLMVASLGSAVIDTAYARMVEKSCLIMTTVD